MTRPMIGITTYREPATWGRWDRVDATLLPAAYLDGVRAGGGSAVLIPPIGPGDDAAAIVARLDGLVLSGGPDVNPSRYSQEPHPATGMPRDERDVSEMALLQAADDIDLPVLGVCRGMQVMAVTDGGELMQHVPDAVGHDRHCPGPDTYGPIDVHTVPGTRLAEIIGPVATVPCHHHQAVAAHPGSMAVGHAADGLLEAIETPGERFRLGVQWHPEAPATPLTADARLFAALVVAASRDRRSVRG